MKSKIHKLINIVLLCTCLSNGMLFAQNWQPYIPTNELEDTLTRDIITSEYEHIQKKICEGWNTWNNNSVLSYVQLPEGFSLNLCLASSDNKTYLSSVIPLPADPGEELHISLGMRSDYGDYTSLIATFKGTDISIESASDDGDELILIKPQSESGNYIVVEAGILWGKQGLVGKQGTNLIGKFSDRIIRVSSTSSPLPTSYLESNNPRLTFHLNKTIAVYTGRERTLDEIERLIKSARIKEEKRALRFGELADEFRPIQTLLAWNTIYDPANNRAITPVSRAWNKDQGGWTLYAWDTFLSSYMFGLFNKDMAYANVIEIVKGITSGGFIPGRISVNRGRTNDRSQPPLGSMVALALYHKFHDIWFLEEVYNELLSWNRWWPKKRINQGFLSWGYDGAKPTQPFWLENAKYLAICESGLDNTPMFDDVPYDTVTHTLDVADVGLMSMYINDCNSLQEIAHILGRTDDAKELKKRADQFNKKLTRLWDDHSGIFLNKRLDTGKKSLRISPTNFYPMLAKTCSQKQTEIMINKYYFNPEQFYGDYMIPSTPRNDPAFKDNDYWRGRIWGPMNFLVYLGMRNYNIPKARRDLINKSRNMFMKNWKKSGGAYENYNATTGIGNDVKKSDGYYSWGALMLFMDFIEKGYMQ